MAENLKNSGVSVTIVEMRDHVIAPLDFDIACDIHTYLESKGISLLLNTAVEQITESADQLTVRTNGGEVHCDFVILAVGVAPDTAFLKGSGIPLNERGAILTDQHMRALPNVYAVGDATAVSDFITEKSVLIPLAGPANKQGRIAADNICGIPSEYKGTQGSSVQMCIRDSSIEAQVRACREYAAAHELSIEAVSYTHLLSVINSQFTDPIGNSPDTVSYTHLIKAISFAQYKLKMHSPQ